MPVCFPTCPQESKIYEFNIDSTLYPLRRDLHFCSADFLYWPVKYLAFSWQLFWDTYLPLSSNKKTLNTQMNWVCCLKLHTKIFLTARISVAYLQRFFIEPSFLSSDLRDELSKESTVWKEVQLPSSSLDFHLSSRWKGPCWSGGKKRQDRST